MKVIYMSVTGNAIAEDVPPHKRWIEMKDGFHHVTGDSVLKHKRHTKDAIVIIWQGVPDPEGVSASVEERTRILREQEIMRQHRLPMSISRRWWRMLIRGLVLFGKVAIVTTVIAMLVTIMIMLARVFG